MLLRGDGFMVGAFDYDTAGKTTQQVGSKDTALQFQGQIRDTETGFTYLRARYLDPKTNQFITVDPIASQTWSRYGYADNDGVNYGDPTGLLTWGEAFGAVVDANDFLIQTRLDFEFGAANALTFGLLSSAAENAPVNDGSAAYQTGEAASWLIPGGAWVKAGAKGTSLGYGCIQRVTKGSPKPSPKFVTPTNAAQYPPSTIPQGYSVRQMGPTQQYPNGYWRMYNKDGHAVDPSIGKQPGNVSRAEFNARTHVPLPGN